jgi:putative tricarboxylic transport membrane protein
VTTNSIFDIGVLLVFGVVGYVFKKLDIPIAPMAFTLILGPLTENSLRQALSMSGGDFAILGRSYMSIGLLVLATAALSYSLWMAFRGKKPAMTDAA